MRAKRFYLAYDDTGRVVVTEARPAKPAVVWMRTRVHADAVASRLNDEDDAEVTEDGERVTA